MTTLRAISRTLVSAAAVFVLAVPTLTLPAQAAPAPGSQCQVGPGPKDNLYVDIHTISGFIACDSDGDEGRPIPQSCPQSLWYNPASRECDLPAKVDSRSTLTGGTARLSLLPAGVTGLTATLIDAGGTPVWNAQIEFRDETGQLLCSARTDWLGKATCDSTNVVGSVETLLLGYKASFSGSGNVDEATGQGTVALL